MSEWVRVAKAADLAEGVPLEANVENESVCIVRVNGAVYAFRNSCTHAEFPLCDGGMVDDYVIECGLHGAQFDVRDGSVVAEPAEEPLCTYQVQERDGAIWVRLG